MRISKKASDISRWKFEYFWISTFGTIKFIFGPEKWTPGHMLAFSSYSINESVDSSPESDPSDRKISPDSFQARFKIDIAPFTPWQQRPKKKIVDVRTEKQVYPKIEELTYARALAALTHLFPIPSVPLRTTLLVDMFCFTARNFRCAHILDSIDSTWMWCAPPTGLFILTTTPQPTQRHLSFLRLFRGALQK